MAFTKEAGGNPQAAETCRNWNEGRCNFPSGCRYKHAFRTCGGDHPASEYTASASGISGHTELASGPNSIPVRPAVSKQWELEGILS